MLIPRRCPLCERPGPAPCASCASGLRRAGRLAPVAGLDSVAAVFAYEGALRSMLLALKYRNRRDALGWLGGQVATLAVQRVGPCVDVVTWAPTSRRRAGRRGYDQAELLARVVGRELRCPVRGLLRHTGRVPQTGLDAAARHLGPGFEARRSVTGTVLVVDDIVTTGSTLLAAARALRAAGAGVVHGVVVARTPHAARPARTSSASPGVDVAGLQRQSRDPRGGPECTSPSAAAKR